MKATIKIEMDNAAFEDGNAGAELARILGELAAKVSRVEITPGRGWALFDVNGNKVGTFEVTE